MASRVQQGGAHGIDRFSELRHPLISWHHPEMKMVRRIFVIEIVDVLDAELLLLLCPQLLDEGHELSGFARHHICQKPEMPLRSDNN
ncbi:hypothetical protein JVX98_27650 [Ensifer sp. PDNC004]|uniref:hypothetical protein n=1 Tax=Ensifer sp. PDNC004 TaxID=2811423 RepID=UPI00196325AF|nr:hypothetical protein [Ensifer sp. PDNC004]QRY68074.1 hypothetical protein JVX98_27650 [Ensifer sp. PDNC004]